ncbi:hypothetical protein Spla01_06602 [Streptomyces platensis]|uniref:Uncharacterized protein n=1 Tax=Streptomyces platensis TaxID=58346 RepID=A0ABX3Y1Z3_STRPT|nr:hypothetical protein BG653_01492 [Streptomyces platensis]
MNPFSDHPCLRNDLAPATSSEIGAHGIDCLDLIYWVASTPCRRQGLRSGGGAGYFELRTGRDGVRIAKFAAMFLVSLPRFQALRMESIESTSPSWGFKVLLFDSTGSRLDVSKTSFDLGESVVVDAGYGYAHLAHGVGYGSPSERSPLSRGTRPPCSWHPRLPRRALRSGRWLSYSVGVNIADAIHQAVLQVRAAGPQSTRSVVSSQMPAPTTGNRSCRETPSSTTTLRLRRLPSPDPA